MLWHVISDFATALTEVIDKELSRKYAFGSISNNGLNS